MLRKKSAGKKQAGDDLQPQTMEKGKLVNEWSLSILNTPF